MSCHGLLKKPIKILVPEVLQFVFLVVFVLPYTLITFIKNSSKGLYRTAYNRRRQLDQTTPLAFSVISREIVMSEDFKKCILFKIYILKLLCPLMAIWILSSFALTI